MATEANNRGVVVSLDCESRASALSSISEIYDLPKQDIEDFVLKTDLDHHFATTQTGDPPDWVFARLFEQYFEKHQPQIDRVYWFHVSRVKRGTSFSDGLLPLDKSLDFIWKTIFEIFKGTEHEANLKSMRINGVHNRQYSQKVRSPIHAGPFGMLIREAVFRREESCTRNYFEMSEIMKDICRGYETQFGDNIESTVQDSLAPCIVKFWAEPRIIRDCITTSLYYLYRIGISEQ